MDTLEGILAFIGLIGPFGMVLLVLLGHVKLLDEPSFSWWDLLMAFLVAVVFSCAAFLAYDIGTLSGADKLEAIWQQSAHKFEVDPASIHYEHPACDCAGEEMKQ